MDTSEKIKNGIIRIENEHIVGLGIGNQESIDLKALDEFFGKFTARDVRETLDEIVQRIGSLGLHIYHNREHFPDPTGAISAGLPNDDDLYYTHEVAKLFNP